MLKVRQLSIFILISSLLASTPARADEAEQLNSLLGLFGTNCSVLGRFSQDATATINNFVHVLTDLKNDPNCQSSMGAISDLMSASQDIAILQSPASENETTILGLESSRVELFRELSTETNPQIIASLNQQIRDTQIELARLKGVNSKQEDNERTYRHYRALANLNSTTHVIMDRLAANENCWGAHPEILSNVAAFGAAVANSTALDVATGGISAAIGAGAVLTANIINYIQDRFDQRRIVQFSRLLQPTALICTLEQMSRQWCNAQDALDASDALVNAIQEQERKSQPNDGQSPVVTADPNNAWYGLKLLNRDIPVIARWLEHVLAGNDSSSSAIANRRSDLEGRELMLRLIKIQVDGMIGDKNSLFDAAKGNPEQQWNIAKDIVSTTYLTIYGMNNSSSSGSPVNPMSKIYDTGFAPFYLLGANLQDSDSFKERGQDGKPLSSYKSFSSFHYRNWPSGIAKIDYSLTGIHARFQDWYELASANIKREKEDVYNVDPAQIFASSRNKLSDPAGISAREALDHLNIFLRAHSPVVPSNPPTTPPSSNNSRSNPRNNPPSEIPNIYQDTLNRIAAMTSIMDNVAAGKQDPKIGLSAIGADEIASLGVSTDFFQGRMEYLAKAIVGDMLQNHQGIPDDLALRLLAAEDVIDGLKRLTGANDLHDLQLDASNAQTMLRGSMIAYYKVFPEVTGNSIAQLDDLRDPTNARDPALFSKTNLCLNLLSYTGDTTDFAKNFGDKKLQLSRCLGLQDHSRFTNGPASDPFTAEYISKTPWSKRVCSYYNFRRKNHTYEKLHVDDNGVTGTQELLMEVTPLESPALFH